MGNTNYHKGAQDDALCLLLEFVPPSVTKLFQPALFLAIFLLFRGTLARYESSVLERRLREAKDQSFCLNTEEVFWPRAFFRRGKGNGRPGL